METYHGHVRTPQDAIILFEACRLGVLPRVQRRLSEKERQQIRSGSVFVWDEREAGMRRWTDGKSWSASRVSGSFLTYREMEGKRGGSGFTPSQPVKRVSTTKSQDGSRSGEGEPDGDSGEDGPEGYRYKQDGLMKQSFSITTNSGQHLHLISYYARLQPTASPLKQPSTDTALRHIRPAKGMYPEATVNEASSVPAVTRGPMPGSPFAGAQQQIAVAPPYPHAIPIGFPPGYPPPGPWVGSPVGHPYYYPHPPPHVHSPLHYPYHHPYGHPPPGPGMYDRPPHLPPPASAAPYTPGYPPGSRPPLPSALSHSSVSHAANQYSSDAKTAHLPSAGPNGANGHPSSLPPIPANSNKPLTPPPSDTVSSTDARPHSSETNTNGATQKVLPTIGALIHSDAPSSTPPPPHTATSTTDQRESNGASTERAGSKSPGAGPTGPGGLQLRDLPGDKGSCRQDMMAIAALDGRFNKPTT